ncbi:MAG: TA system VapC family ribonuclease toxin [Acidobacteriota bacterium]
MIAVDTNILVYAHRVEMPQHRAAERRLRELATGAAAWAIPVFCLGEFVRVVTHPKVFRPASTVDQALGALAALLASQSLQLLMPGDRYPELLAGAIRGGRATGNLVFDAQIAAVCREHGATRILTLDRDLARFPGLTLVPLDGADT